MSSTQSITALAQHENGSTPYQMITKLGHGGFGEVHLMESRLVPGFRVAAKLQLVSESNRSIVQKEYNIHKELSRHGHINVIHIFEMQETPMFYYLFMEFADCGTLSERLPPCIPMSPEMAQMYFKQLIAGLKFIHGLGVVHRDIKPRNLLIGSRDILKICDFGQATTFMQSGLEILLVYEGGTSQFEAPEVCEPWHRGPPLDVWSAGVTLMILQTKGVLWDSPHMECAEYRSWIEGTDLKKSPWNRMNKMLLDLLRKILTADVDQRLSLEEIEKSPWMRLSYGSTQMEHDVITID
ncbi:hypothetical protein CRE_21389 [Caenorhabditis remanei]|uniref:Protein kinase domain-containing protein n=1 Tax=Caenorhabditis remanei TaxID=31234 RepID=E3MUP5_CAERE|nr:hypothetical protein CRE_21389 [Caenorhabditis remanei]